MFPRSEIKWCASCYASRSLVQPLHQRNQSKILKSKDSEWSEFRPTMMSLSKFVFKIGWVFASYEFARRFTNKEFRHKTFMPNSEPSGCCVRLHWICTITHEICEQQIPKFNINVRMLCARFGAYVHGQESINKQSLTKQFNPPLLIFTLVRTQWDLLKYNWFFKY